MADPNVELLARVAAVRVADAPSFVATKLEAFLDRGDAPLAFLVAPEEQPGVLLQRQRRVDRHAERLPIRVVRVGHDGAVFLHTRRGEPCQKRLAHPPEAIAAFGSRELRFELAQKCREPLDLLADERLVVVSQVLEVAQPLQQTVAGFRRFRGAGKRRSDERAGSLAGPRRPARRRQKRQGGNDQVVPPRIVPLGHLIQGTDGIDDGRPRGGARRFENLREPPPGRLFAGAGRGQVPGEKRADPGQELGRAAEPLPCDRHRLRADRDGGELFASGRGLVALADCGGAELARQLAAVAQDDALRIENDQVRRSPQELDDEPPLRRTVLPPGQAVAHLDDPVPWTLLERHQDGAGEILVEPGGEPIGGFLGNPPGGQEMETRQVRPDGKEEVVPAGGREAEEVAVPAEMRDPQDLLLDQAARRLRDHGLQEELVHGTTAGPLRGRPADPSGL